MSVNVLAAEVDTEEAQMLRRARRLQRLAAALAIASVLEVLVIAAISALGDENFVLALDLASVGFLGSIVLFSVVGALIAVRRPYTRVAWVMMAIGLSLGAGLILFGYGIVGQGREWPAALQILVLSQV